MAVHRGRGAASQQSTRRGSAGGSRPHPPICSPTRRSSPAPGPTGSSRPAPATAGGHCSSPRCATSSGTAPCSRSTGRRATTSPSTRCATCGAGPTTPTVEAAHELIGEGATAIVVLGSRVDRLTTVAEFEAYAHLVPVGATWSSPTRSSTGTPSGRGSAPDRSRRSSSCSPGTATSWPTRRWRSTHPASTRAATCGALR